MSIQHSAFAVVYIDVWYEDYMICGSSVISIENWLVLYMCFHLYFRELGG